MRKKNLAPRVAGQWQLEVVVMIAELHKNNEFFAGDEVLLLIVLNTSFLTHIFKLTTWKCFAKENDSSNQEFRKSI